MICGYKTSKRNIKVKTAWARVKDLMGTDVSRRIQLSKDKKSTRRVE